MIRCLLRLLCVIVLFQLGGEQPALCKPWYKPWVKRKDPLDKVRGTTAWREAKEEDLEAEWEDWYRMRVLWRTGLRQQRIEKGRNERVAALLRLPRPAPGSLAGASGRRQSGIVDGKTPEPPKWVEVPVEHLDEKGRAVDEEGDELMRKLGKGKKRR
jgi:hypothetical protein